MKIPSHYADRAELALVAAERSADSVAIEHHHRRARIWADLALASAITLNARRTH